MDLFSVFAYRLACMATRHALRVVIDRRPACPYHHRLFRGSVLHHFPAFVVPVVFNTLGMELTPHVLCRPSFYHHPAHH